MPDREYIVVFVRRELYEATVTAGSQREAIAKARVGKWDDVWETGEADPLQVRRCYRESDDA